MKEELIKIYREAQEALRGINRRLEQVKVLYEKVESDYESKLAEVNKIYDDACLKQDKLRDVLHSAHNILRIKYNYEIEVDQKEDEQSE